MKFKFDFTLYFLGSNQKPFGKKRTPSRMAVIKDIKDQVRK